MLSRADRAQRTFLIVNADDYGLTAGVNRGIEEARSRGILTSTTVLANGEAAHEVESLRGLGDEFSAGIHVNLTLGRPIVDASRVPSIVDAEGTFLSKTLFIRRMLTRRLDWRDVARETSAQVARLRELGLEPSHWDTHHHVSELPQLTRVLVAVMKEAGLPCARTPRLWVANGVDSPVVARWRWRLERPRRLAAEVARAASAALISRQFVAPAHRLADDLVRAPGASPRQRWEIMFSNLPPGTCEVTMHPGLLDQRLQDLSPGMADARLVDLEIATSPRVRALLDEAGVTLIPFSRLPECSQR